MTRQATSILLGPRAPRVLTVPMISAALSDRQPLPARGTVFAWLARQKQEGAIRPLTRGLYLNQMAQPIPAAAEAAAYIRGGAIVSLQTVLGDAGISNNYSDIVTSVVPIIDGIAPSSRSVKTITAEFRFHAMPARFVDERAGAVEDRLDLNVTYPRATPEKALLDWIYLGRSTKTKFAGPPLDLDMTKLKRERLLRLSRKMGLSEALNEFLKRQRQYEFHDDERLNPASRQRRPR
jgi:hypothetical protein